MGWPITVSPDLEFVLAETRHPFGKRCVAVRLIGRMALDRAAGIDRLRARDAARFVATQGCLISAERTGILRFHKHLRMPCCALAKRRHDGISGVPQESYSP